MSEKNPFMDIDLGLDALGDLSTEELNTQAHNTCEGIGTEAIKQEYEKMRTMTISEYLSTIGDSIKEIDKLHTEIRKIKEKRGDIFIENDERLDKFAEEKNKIDIGTIDFLGADKNIKIVFEKIQNRETLTEHEQQFAALLKENNNDLGTLFTAYNKRIHESVNGEKKMGSYMAIYAIVDDNAQLAEYYQDILKVNILKLEEQLKISKDPINSQKIRDEINTYQRRIEKTEVFKTEKGNELATRMMKGEDVSQELEDIVSQKLEEGKEINTNMNDSTEIKNTLKTPDGKIIEGVTGDEHIKMNNNPRYRENYINAYTWFEDNNLLGVWKYRENIKNATNTINLNLESSSFTEGKLTLFGNKLIKIANTILEEQYNGDIPEDKKLIENAYTLNGVEAELRKFTGAGSDVTNHRTYGFSGTDKIIHGLEKMGIVGGTYFHTMKLTEMMEDNNLNT